MRRNRLRLFKHLVGVVLFIFGLLMIRQLLSFFDLNTVSSEEVKHVISDTSNGNGKYLHFLDSKYLRINWQDADIAQTDQLRNGPGENGQPVVIGQEEEKQKAELYRANGFNALASDKISLSRSIPDIRHPKCHKAKYLFDLPTVSIIFPFHNEHLSTLLRSVHSVVDRASARLVHEVILVDDFSSKDQCKKPLDDYIRQHFTNVKVVRADRRVGLIRARLLGAQSAMGHVLLFLDSHVEANVNYLPPLLEPIALDYRTAVCPFIDVIDYESFAYRAQDEGARGAFDWELFYKRLPLLARDKLDPSRPFESPVMAGGLFAISRRWFWELGGYDPGLDIWGGEQYELSFKIWQCGGRMLDAPCARIGHIYRKFAPFSNPGVGDFVGRNYRRVAEVWMDEFAEYLYKRRPRYRSIDPGNLTDQRAIRSRLDCKPFKWFMESVAFDLPKYYPPVEPSPLASGELRNKASALCVDTRFKNSGEAFQLQACIKDEPQVGGEQQFEFSWRKDIRPKRRSVCLDASQSVPGAPVILFACHGMHGNQRFKYNLDTLQLYHPISNQCLDCDVDNHEIFMFPCNKGRQTQAWTFDSVNVTAVRADWHLPLD